MNRQKLLWYTAAALAVLGTICFGTAGMRFSAILWWSVAIALIVCAVLDRLGREKKWAKWCARALFFLLCAGFVFFLFLEARILSGARGETEQQPVSCVIVLGAGVDGTQPSPVLLSRLEAALGYVKDKPDIPIIVSGSKGNGEQISEAECMARWLTAHGIEADRVWKEEQATSTRTNFLRAYEMMEQRGVDRSEGFAFVTSDFHIARSRILAGDPAAYGVAAHLPEGLHYFAVEVNFYIREAFALANEMLLGVDLDI